jgi:hypothetical protein
VMVAVYYTKTRNVPALCVNGHNDWNDQTDPYTCNECSEPLTDPVYDDEPTEYSDDECDDWDW